MRWLELGKMRCIELLRTVDSFTLWPEILLESKYHLSMDDHDGATRIFQGCAENHDPRLTQVKDSQ